MFPHDCTVYREVAGVWSRYPVYGVLWQDIEGISSTKSGLRDTNSLDLTVPFKAGFQPCKKDLVCKGIVDYEIQRKPSELFQWAEVRTILTVDTFDFGGMPHYRVGGK